MPLHYDPLSGLPTNVVAEGLQEGRMRFFLENNMFEDEVNTFDWMVRTRRPVALLSEGTGGKLERALRYRELLRTRSSSAAPSPAMGRAMTTWSASGWATARTTRYS
jgi:hypothetical protein